MALGWASLKRRGSATTTAGTAHRAGVRFSPDLAARDPVTGTANRCRARVTVAPVSVGAPPCSAPAATQQATMSASPRQAGSPSGGTGNKPLGARWGVSRPEGHHLVPAFGEA